ncbi:hypothetical protein SCALM49S_08476 [Streptomyces californicus]
MPGGPAEVIGSDSLLSRTHLFQYQREQEFLGLSGEIERGFRLVRRTGLVQGVEQGDALVVDVRVAGRGGKPGRSFVQCPELLRNFPAVLVPDSEPLPVLGEQKRVRVQEKDVVEGHVSDRHERERRPGHREGGIPVRGFRAGGMELPHHQALAHGLPFQTALCPVEQTPAVPGEVPDQDHQRGERFFSLRNRKVAEVLHAVAQGAHQFIRAVRGFRAKALHPDRPRLPSGSDERTHRSSAPQVLMLSGEILPDPLLGNALILGCRFDHLHDVPHTVFPEEVPLPSYASCGGM